MHADDIRLWRMAVFDVLINNADRKGGHVLRGVDGDVYGVDHGVCLHVEDKLRTVLWGWAGKTDRRRHPGGGVRPASTRWPTRSAMRWPSTSPAPRSRRCALRARALLDNPVMPGPDRHRPIPWPAF